MIVADPAQLDELAFGDDTNEAGGGLRPWVRRSTRPATGVGIIEPWASRWHGGKHDFARLLLQDKEIRDLRHEGVRLRRDPAHRDRAHR